MIDSGYTLDGTYLAGYTIECALKALILKQNQEKPETLQKITAGAKWHDAIVLCEFLLVQGQEPPPIDLVRRFRRFRWTTDLRYKIGRVHTSEAKGFLKTAKLTYDWVERQMP